MRAIRSLWLVACLVPALACATKDEAADPILPQEPLVAAPADASTPDEPAVPSSIPVPQPTGTHLDGDAIGYQPRGYLPRAAAKGKVIELVLRSSPPGAMASIDGKAIGATPTFWSGTADQRAHEFTFVKEGHTMARYRFVATHSGVVHGSLLPLLKGEALEAAEAAHPTDAPEATAE